MRNLKVFFQRKTLLFFHKQYAVLICVLYTRILYHFSSLKQRRDFYSPRTIGNSKVCYMEPLGLEISPIGIQYNFEDTFFDDSQIEVLS